jgi:fructose/tagatose bisphosphate aldolase
MSLTKNETPETKTQDQDTVRFAAIDAFARTAVFETDAKARDGARHEIRRMAAGLGILPASIEELYRAIGRGETGRPPFTVPAMNLRAMTYDAARAVFRAALRLDAGAFILEIARSEMGYTDQRPGEYAAVVLAAAIREGHTGPVFIQGDHFQANAKKFAADPKSEIRAIEALISEAIPAGFLNIDIDTSTLVDMSQKTEALQQRVNSETAAHFTRFIRERQPKGVTISVGGEIGEVGKEVSSPEEFRAYMDGYLALLPKGMPGVSKISVNTGTSHGGVVLPDGTIAKVAIHFDALQEISRIARTEYGLSGAVQHGASTLPPEAFHEFPDHEASEVHLATEFQNMTYDRIPAGLRVEMYEWVKQNAADERKPKDTEEQFLYRSRKKAIGPFKRRLWDLPEPVRAEIGQALQEKFEFLFRKLRVVGTKDIVARWVKPVALEFGSAASQTFHRDDEAGD